MSKVKELSNLMRFPLGIMASLSGLAAGFIAIKIEDSTLSLLDIIQSYLGQLLVGFPIPMLIVCGAMVINDYYDYEADLRNDRQDRPLVRGVFSRQFALLLSIAMLALGGLLTLVLFLFFEKVETYLFPTVLVFIGISVAYSTFLKRYGLLGNIAVSLSYPAAVILSMGVVGVTQSEAIITITSFGFMIFLAALGREVLKGVMDMEGDEAQGVRTIAIRYGPLNAARLATFFFVLAVPLAPIPLVVTFLESSIIPAILYSIFTTLMIVLLLYAGVTLVQDPSKETGTKGRKITKLAFWSVVLGFFLASLTLGL